MSCRKSTTCDTKNKYRVGRILIPCRHDIHSFFVLKIVTYNYAGALKLAEQVVEPVNKFFDSVMVMDENVDIKNNRLALLEQAKEVTNAVGDLSCIVL